MKTSKQKPATEIKTAVPKERRREQDSLTNGAPSRKKDRIQNGPWRPKWWHYVVAALAVLFIGFEIYEPALRGPFLLDDTYLPFMSPNAPDLPLRIWLNVRPFLMITFWANYKLAGTETYQYHWFNVFVHVLNAMLAFLIVRKMLEWVGEKGWKRECLGAFAGLVFLAHPVQTESVSYVASRSEVLSIFFFLAAFAVFLYRTGQGISWLRAISVLALFAVAANTKEHTVVLPALLLMTDYYFNPGFTFAGIRNNWKLYLLTLAGSVFGGMAIIVVLRHSPSAGFGLKDFKWYEYLFTQFRSIWQYLRLYLLPVNQTLDYDFPVSHTLMDHAAILYGLGLVGLAAAAWIYRRKFPLASFGYFGFLLLLAPTSSILPIRDVMVEHRLYLPFICLLLMTVDFLRRWDANPAAMGTLLTAVFVILSVLTYQRNELWASAIGIWNDATLKAPKKSRPRFQLAFAYYEAGRCDESVREYDAASKLDVPDYRLLVDWALAEDCASRPDLAIEKLKAAARLEPSAHVFSQIGMEYGKQGKGPEALQALDQAELLDAGYMMTYVYKGNVYMTTGDYAKAVEQYQRALAIDPASQVAREGLARAQKQPQSHR